MAQKTFRYRMFTICLEMNFIESHLSHENIFENNKVESVRQSFIMDGDLLTQSSNICMRYERESFLVRLEFFFSLFLNVH